MPASVKVENGQARILLGNLRDAISDLRPALSKPIAEHMRSSIIRTFRDEGSPAGSWPKLAISTLRNKKYTTGHMLLVMTNRLRTSFIYTTTADTLTISNNVPYAGVHQFGSADYRGGISGPAGSVTVRAHIATRLQRPKYGRELRTDKKGRARMTRVRLNKGAKDQVSVREHKRSQNIPPRPFLVFRPEDPSAIAQIVNTYIAGRAGKAAAL